jgi:hypothetical protein
MLQPIFYWSPIPINSNAIILDSIPRNRQWKNLRTKGGGRLSGPIWHQHGSANVYDQPISYNTPSKCFWNLVFFFRCQCDHAYFLPCFREIITWYCSIDVVCLIFFNLRKGQSCCLSKSRFALPSFSSFRTFASLYDLKKRSLWNQQDIIVNDLKNSLLIPHFDMPPSTLKYILIYYSCLIPISMPF